MQGGGGGLTDVQMASSCATPRCMAILVYLVRHGVAEPGGGRPDKERKLTEGGQAAVRQVGLVLREQGTRLDALLSSPYVRARETAAILADAMHLSNGPTICPALAAGAEPEEMTAELQAVVDATAVMLVGHMPDMGRVAHHLLEEGGGRSASFRPGAVACIEFPQAILPGTGKVRWHRQPEQLVSAGK